jgi:putative spermidine/putrescine transport system ATP-binding protein
MSDRMAIFNHGRIEQIGTPAEVYERPATAFVAGFVGTSNLLSGDVAEAVLGRRGTFTVRPEKIRIVETDAPAAAGFLSVPGRVRDVVYLGSDTRYIVTLERGGELAVLAQNVTTSSMEVLALKDREVRLTWDERHTLPVEPGDDQAGQHTEEKTA